MISNVSSVSLNARVMFPVAFSSILMITLMFPRSSTFTVFMYRFVCFLVILMLVVFVAL